MQRREFVGQILSGAVAGAGAAHSWIGSTWAAPLAATNVPPLGERPPAAMQATAVAVDLPRRKLPVSLIVDDSTALVNLAHFAIPQFAEVFPDRYRQDWKALPREIPDDFVREFRDWCGAWQVRGKYSMVPYPACVGWLDRDLPGWSRADLQASLRLVRDTMCTDWDIHPEMVSHTWVVDTKTGRPLPDRSARSMENWEWSQEKSPEQLAEYLEYALTILKNVELPCTGVTTPGGFCNRNVPALAQSTLWVCQQVFQAEIPHYFRHLYTDARSVAPRVEYAADLTSPAPRCVVSIRGCTGDWFGGWDGLEIGSADRFITPDLNAGRLVEVLARPEPAVLVCHWPGIYANGGKQGFHILQTVADRLKQRYGKQIEWMKLSTLARYWAARELTSITWDQSHLSLHAPFACPDFTLRLDKTQLPPQANPLGNSIRLIQLAADGIVAQTSLRPLADLDQLEVNSWYDSDRERFLCFALPAGTIRLEFARI